MDPPLCRNLLADLHGEVFPAFPALQAVFWGAQAHPAPLFPSVSVSGTPVACSSGCQAIVDTGTTLLAVPVRALRTLLSHLGASSSGEVRPQDAPREFCPGWNGP